MDENMTMTSTYGLKKKVCKVGARCKLFLSDQVSSVCFIPLNPNEEEQY